MLIKWLIGCKVSSRLLAFLCDMKNKISMIWHSVWSLRRIILGIYLFQFVLAAFVGIQTYEMMSSGFGTSMILDDVIKGFSYAALMDFKNVHGELIDQLFRMMRWIILLYLIVKSLISAGLISKIVSPERTFWDAGQMFFIQVFLIGIVSILMALTLSAIIWIPISSNAFSWLTGASDERIFIMIVGLAIFIWFMLLSVVYVWSTSAKFYVIGGGNAILVALRLAVVGLLDRWLRLIIPFFIIALCFVICYYLVGFLEINLGVDSLMKTILFMGIHMVFNVFKVALGVASLLLVYDVLRIDDVGAASHLK